ncbi:type III-A CRISPR-associated protein Csm2 [Sulfobacillus sp. hq2]|uniref:type III-A CRISPR-associated protein Csm2 n=1 Tax=Sulfobacillus sp. hq2 TaxID=2039167 RepID=UPI000CD00BE2|nr:type III-A CRISPR-associated protein Csm2 [Sulfobacillus sp. hq2]POB10104.1 type III-A CRISPR-associated protein Csm2 [Sulfobacillus sp. hq2]
MLMSLITENTYLRQGYLNPEGGYRREIYREEAQFVVDKLARGTSIHALRRFYNRVKGLERSMDRGRLFNQQKSQLYELQSHAYYAAKRHLVNAFFPTFMDRNVDQAVTNWEQFEGFVKHFESVVAYFPTEPGFPRQGGTSNGQAR